MQIYSIRNADKMTYNRFERRGAGFAQPAAGSRTAIASTDAKLAGAGLSRSLTREAALGFPES